MHTPSTCWCWHTDVDVIIMWWSIVWVFFRKRKEEAGEQLLSWQILHKHYYIPKFTETFVYHSDSWCESCSPVREQILNTKCVKRKALKEAKRKITPAGVIFEMLETVNLLFHKIGQNAKAEQTSYESACQLCGETGEEGAAFGIFFIFFGCKIIVPVTNFEVFSSYGKQHALKKQICEHWDTFVCTSAYSDTQFYKEPMLVVNFLSRLFACPCLF